MDDCSRYQVIEIYPARTAANTILFLEKMAEGMHFPIQSIQTDRGREFFAYKVQDWLAELGIAMLRGNGMLCQGYKLIIYASLAFGIFNESWMGCQLSAQICSQIFLDISEIERY
ncbi:MAG: hypothetical protein A2144_08480 [Chloroflexi bacterium RBG_16_50_9]|nr:MAG: hypothetical protein A2144_08480 [Chloroflexi bacterium RBG_16_50_9]